MSKECILLCKGHNWVEVTLINVCIASILCYIHIMANILCAVYIYVNVHMRENKWHLSFHIA